ncbi:unnamed protein product, partial [Urochloa humidicola]
RAHRSTHPSIPPLSPSFPRSLSFSVAPRQFPPLDPAFLLLTPPPSPQHSAPLATAVARGCRRKERSPCMIRQSHGSLEDADIAGRSATISQRSSARLRRLPAAGAPPARGTRTTAIRCPSSIPTTSTRPRSRTKSGNTSWPWGCTCRVWRQHLPWRTSLVARPASGTLPRPGSTSRVVLSRPSRDEQSQ